jgi:DNA-binding transcriptional LysR family regulator
MMLACPPGHPLAKLRQIPLTELDGERFVDFPAGWGTRLAADLLFHDAGLHREIAVEVADIPNVTDLVRAGFGFALLSPSTVPDPRGLARDTSGQTLSRVADHVKDRHSAPLLVRW